MNLQECSQGRNNNLNFIRFMAAIAVIFSHSYPFSYGKGHSDCLNWLTHGNMNFGGLAVSVFFFYGGFLICKSMFKSKTAKKYFRARLIRILPPLIVVVFSTTFILGPFVTEMSALEYFSNVGTYRYLLNSFFVLVHDLPGVFLHNIYGSTVNGPLWTLPVEFLCYVMCFVAYKLQLLDRKRAKWTVLIVITGNVVLKIVLGDEGVLGAALRPMNLFYIGMLCYIYRERIKLDIRLALIGLFGLIISIPIGLFSIVVYLCIPYILLYVGYGTRKKFSAFGNHFEISYGIYLFGSPIQQTVSMLLGNRQIAWMNFLMSVPVAILGGFLLCVLVDKPIDRVLHKK